jgi:biotin transport system substrate-specific component|tara:strand:- start:3105 stop:3929 length:825 start_codon:yes stop_codon:yes gene_type:complete
METIRRYKQLRYNFFKWKYESSFINMLILSLFFAALTGIGAQIKIYLPFTPIPITGQVFFVLLTGVLLGRYAVLSQTLYVGLGGLGMPWFAPAAGMGIFSNGGMSILTGVTGGYLLGFVLAAGVIGWFVDRFVYVRTIPFQFCLLLLGVSIIYTLGALQLSFFLGTGFQDTILKGVLPFIPGDILKAVGALMFSVALLPKESYNGEVDFKKRSAFRIPGIIVTTILTLFFLILFLMKGLQLDQVTVDQFIMQTAWYVIPLLIIITLLIRQFKIN